MWILLFRGDNSFPFITFKEPQSSLFGSGELFMSMFMSMYSKQIGLILQPCLREESWQLLHFPHLLVLHVRHLDNEIHS